MIKRNSDEDLSTASISFSCFFCSLSSECLVRSILIVNEVNYLWWPTRSIRIHQLGCSNGSDKCRINPWLFYHLGWNFLATICTLVLPLTNQFLETLQAKVVPTRCLKQDSKQESAQARLFNFSEKLMQKRHFECNLIDYLSGIQVFPTLARAAYTHLFILPWSLWLTPYNKEMVTRAWFGNSIRKCAICPRYRLSGQQTFKFKFLAILAFQKLHKARE